MQIGREGIENLLVNMVLKKKLSKNTNTKRCLSVPFYLGMG
jgi:hypothetical protein